MEAYKLFREIATYANENWKGNFTKDECEENIGMLLGEFEESKECGEYTPAIQSLLENLRTDVVNGSVEAQEFINRIHDLFERSKINWFEKIVNGLRDYSEGEIWTTGDEILVKTESAANTIADILTTLYKTQGEDVTIVTGYYEPEEDFMNNEIDRCTGWWYVNIE